MTITTIHLPGFFHIVKWKLWKFYSSFPSMLSVNDDDGGGDGESGGGDDDGDGWHTY